MKCRICGHDSTHAFSRKILYKYQISYFKCPFCGFLGTEDPYWLKEAYSNPINKSDTGYISRNISLAKKTLLLFITFFGRTSAYLDYGGGYGVFTRLMRDAGLDFYWSDPMTENIFARGFEYEHQHIKALTCFECFEHFSDPLLELEKMLKTSRNILFSTDLIPDSPVPNPDTWHYYGFHHGQHVSLYSRKTLQYIADKYNLHLTTNGEYLHMFTGKKASSFLFNTLVYCAKFGGAWIARLFLASKTQSDSLQAAHK